jgi:hypothetical protein
MIKAPKAVKIGRTHKKVAITTPQTLSFAYTIVRRMSSRITCSHYGAESRRVLYHSPCPKSHNFSPSRAFAT